MKKLNVLLVLIIGLLSCQKGDKEVSISGEIKGLQNDTIYLYGTNGVLARIDTIVAKDGKFDRTVEIDTIVAATLLLNNKVECPLFLNKGDKIKIQGNANNLNALNIQGNTFNEEFTAFQQAIAGLGKPSNKVLEDKAEEFIRQHQSSLVSIYLLNKYFVQKESPDFAKIKQLIETMTGILQDQPCIEQLTESVEQAEKVTTDKIAPFFSLPNAKGDNISRMANFKDKYLLINFWASWCDDCTKTNTELRKINRTYKKNKDFALLGISLDIDKEAWKAAIKRDTLSWEQVCNFTGLNSEVAKQYAIQTLPTNILIAPSGRILAWDIQGDSLTNKLKEVLKEKTK